MRFAWSLPAGLALGPGRQLCFLQLCGTGPVLSWSGRCSVSVAGSIRLLAGCAGRFLVMKNFSARDEAKKGGIRWSAIAGTIFRMMPMHSSLLQMLGMQRDMGCIQSKLLVIPHQQGNRP